MNPSDRNLDPRQKLRRVMNMELPELVDRSRQETSKLVDRMLPVKRRTPGGVDATALDRFIQHCSRNFFQGVFDPDLADALSNAKADECQLLLVAADRAFHGIFDLLGYRDLRFGMPIDWQLDAVSGKRAPFVHWSKIDVLDFAMVGDSKVTWELNRHQWLVHLAQAWRLTRDERYADAVVARITDWIEANPTGMGINWASSLEVALRLISWSWSIALIADSPALTPEIFAVMAEGLEHHASHVERYLSSYFSPNTHLTGEALGLVYAGVVLADAKRAERWRTLGARVLEIEIERQVRPDGIYFEQSTCYQRYTVDIYLHFIILARRAGLEVAPVVESKVKSMLRALIALRMPDGSMPSIGDEDGGAILPLGMNGREDYRATFSTAAVVFADAECAWAAGSLATDTVWLVGTRAALAFNALGKSQPSSEHCQVFPDGGFVVMRSGWDHKAHALIFDAGPLGCHFSSGHGHADLLSIQCSAFGQRYIVDAGTCCYTADRELRRYFRSTTAHSTVVVDEQPQMESTGPFAWKAKCAARLVRTKATDSLFDAVAEHDAYATLPDPVRHQRRVLFVDSRYWIIVDDLAGAKNHQVDVRFQFAPMPVRTAGEWISASRDGRRGLMLRAFASAPLTASVREGKREPLEGWVSKNYGCLEPAPVVVYSTTMQLPVRVVTLLWPAENIAEPVPQNVIREAQKHM